MTECMLTLVEVGLGRSLGGAIVGLDFVEPAVGLAVRLLLLFF